MFKKFFSFYLYSIFIGILFVSFLIYFYSFNNSKETNPEIFNYYFSTSEFNWPLPGIYTITSQFGPRKSPTSRCII